MFELYEEASLVRDEIHKEMEEFEILKVKVEKYREINNKLKIRLGEDIDDNQSQTIDFMGEDP